MSERRPGLGFPSPSQRPEDRGSDAGSAASKEPENPYRDLLLDLSRMAEPALVTYLKGQIIALHEALRLEKGDVFGPRTLVAGKDVFERYGLHRAIANVLLDNNPERKISVSPSEVGTLAVSGRNQADILLRPGSTYPLLHLDLRQKNENGKRLSSIYDRKKALQIIGSPVLSEADAFLRRIWRLDACEGITEEYRNAQALIWSVAHLAHEQGFLKEPLHPHYDRDILTVRTRR